MISYGPSTISRGYLGPILPKGQKPLPRYPRGIDNIMLILNKSDNYTFKLTIVRLTSFTFHYVKYALVMLLKFTYTEFIERKRSKNFDSNVGNSNVLFSFSLHSSITVFIIIAHVITNNPMFDRWHFIASSALGLTPPSGQCVCLSPPGGSIAFCFQSMQVST